MERKNIITAWISYHLYLDDASPNRHKHTNKHTHTYKHTNIQTCTDMVKVLSI